MKKIFFNLALAVLMFFSLSIPVSADSFQKIYYVYKPHFDYCRLASKQENDLAYKIFEYVSPYLNEKYLAKTPWTKYFVKKNLFLGMLTGFNGKKIDSLILVYVVPTTLYKNSAQFGRFISFITSDLGLMLRYSAQLYDPNQTFIKNVAIYVTSKKVNGLIASLSTSTSSQRQTFYMIHHGIVSNPKITIPSWKVLNWEGIYAEVDGDKNIFNNGYANYKGFYKDFENAFN